MESTRTITPTGPVAPWMGGKRLLAKTIAARIEAVDHQLYAEPFVGMGGVFLRRRQAPPVEVINDYSQDLANLFRILQRHYPQLLDTLRFQLTSRADFTRLCAVDPNTLTDLERAARFLYLQRLSFGGKIEGRTFGVRYKDAARFNLTTLEPKLAEVHERLAGVTIECLPFEKFIPRYDRPTTLFYIDPPWWGHENDYGKEMFSRDDFARLKGLLSNLKGRFIMSLNDHPEVRNLFDEFTIEEVETTYSVGGGKHIKGVTEVLIFNEG
ncbi:MAG: DNA adenine methylase [Magnetospiraceae bacterium]